MTSCHKVLHVAWDGDLGGVQRLLLKFFQSSERRGVVHELCFLNGPGRVINCDSLPNLPLHSVNLKSGLQWGAARRLSQLLEKTQPSLIHLHCDSPAVLYQAHRFNKVPLIYHEHGDSLMRSSNKALLKGLWWMQKRSFNRIIAISDFVARRYAATYPYVESKIVTLHNPLTEDVIPRKAQNPSGPLRIAYLGRLEYQKGADRMVRLAQELLNDEIEIHIIGEGREQASMLAAKLPNMIFHGYQSDPMSYLTTMDLLVVPSRIEPFGLVALEALAAGIPVIGFHDSGVAEIIEDGKSGWLFPQGELSSVAACVREMNGQRDSLVAMGKYGAAEVQHRFALERYVGRLEELYADVVTNFS